MTYRVIIPKKINKFIRGLLNSESVLDRLKLLKWFKSERILHLDIKSMKGKWKGYYRIRIGDVRFLFRIVDNSIVYVMEADYRGKVYK